MFCAFLVITLLAFYTAAEVTTHVAVPERDHSFESLLSLAPTVESDWIVQQETRLRQELGTTNSLPGYLFFFNFGSDATCVDGSFKSAMIRRLNNCYYGVKYTAYVTVKGNYGLKVQYYDDSSCKTPANPTPQEFFFPKNTCVGGVKFFTAAQMPAQPPNFVSGVLFSSYRTKAACDASSDGISGCESFDVYKDNVCFPGRGGDVKYVSCDGTTTTALVYGSIGGQCAGTSITRTYNNDPECRQADIYGGKIERYIIHSCLMG